MDDKTKMFYAAVAIVGVCIGYLFLSHFYKPVGIDSSAFFISIASGLTGYYWGSSKGSQDKTNILNKPKE
jgi:hypothetical protein